MAIRSKAEALDKLMEIVRDLSPGDVDPKPDSVLADDLHWDSLDFVDFSVQFEIATDLDLEDDTIDEAKTVGDLIRIVEAKFD